MAVVTLELLDNAFDFFADLPMVGEKVGKTAMDATKEDIRNDATMI